MKLKVGDKVWVVWNRGHGRACEATVTKVGRKWAEATNIQRSRLDMEFDVVGDAGFTYGSFYPSEVAYLEVLARRLEWQNLKSAIGSGINPPDGVTLAKILEARRLLGLEVSDV